MTARGRRVLCGGKGMHLQGALMLDDSQHGAGHRIAAEDERRDRLLEQLRHGTKHGPRAELDAAAGGEYESFGAIGHQKFEPAVPHPWAGDGFWNMSAARITTCSSSSAVRPNAR